MQPSKFTEYKTRIAKQYLDYGELLFAFQTIKRFSQFYTEHYKFKDFFNNPSPNRILNDSDLIPMQSIFISIVIMYAKCFDENPKRRNIRLKTDFLNGADDKLIKSHEQLIDIRHNFLAHAGTSDYENHQLLLGLNEDGSTIVQQSPENYSLLFGEGVEEDTIVPLIDEIISRIMIKIAKIQDKINDEIDLLSLNANEIINKINSGIPIIENDVEYCKKLKKN